MNTPTPGETRPNFVIPVETASRVATLCKQIAQELDDLSGIVGWYVHDYPDLRALRIILADIDQATTRMQSAHRISSDLWDRACEDEDKWGRP